MKRDNLRTGVMIAGFLLIIFLVSVTLIFTCCRKKTIESPSSISEVEMVTSLTEEETTAIVTTETSTDVSTEATTTVEETTTATPVESTTTVEVTTETSQVQTVATSRKSITTSATTTTETTSSHKVTTITETTQGEQNLPDIQFVKTFSRGTYYAYGGPRKGGSGRQLIDCSIGNDKVKGSIASWYLYKNYGYKYNGKRTMVYLKVKDYSQMDGFYYLDDSCAKGHDNVIDFFFLKNSNCPFQYQGVVKVDCYIVK